VSDRAKVTIATVFLGIAVLAWVVAGGFCVHYYYQNLTLKETRERPTAQEIERVQWKVWELEDALKALQASPEPNSFPTILAKLDDDIAKLNSRKETEKRDIETFVAEVDRLRTEFASALQQLNETRADFTTKVAQEREKRQAELERMAQEMTTERDRKNGLEDDIRVLTEAVAKLEEDKRVTLNGLRQKLAELKKVLNQLVARQEHMKSASGDVDGKVLFVNISDNFVVLDFGAEDRVRKGMKFRVLQVLPGIAPIDKGEVEVREVTKSVSYARILSMTNMENPIQPGDVVANQEYHRNEKLVFVLVGNLKSYNRAEFARFVESMGFEMRDQVDTDTDYLVIGSGVEGVPSYEEQRDLARKLGVKIITENFFLNLVSY